MSETQKNVLKRLLSVLVGLCILVSMSYMYVSQRTRLQQYIQLTMHFDQPNVTNVTNPANTSDYYVTFKNFFDGRGLGNQMFTFAAVVYVAELTGREIVLPKTHTAKQLEEVFELNVKRADFICPCYEFSEKLLSYDERIDDMINDTQAMLKRSIILHGYFQSWKYLRLINERIRKLFKFKAKFTDYATTFLNRKFPLGWKSGFIRVGIHNRRGDFVLTPKSSGFSTAPDSYFRRAMKYFTDRYNQVQFFVASQDKLWTKQYLVSNASSLNVNVVYLFDNSPGEDMAVLSMCDHVIVSSGTYGWWSAWLAKGTTIYYANYPYPNSSLYVALRPADYYPPHWFPME